MPTKRKKKTPRALKTARALRGPKPLRIVDARSYPGRPSSYVPEYAHIAQIMCERLGATDQDLALAFGVSVRQIYRWKLDHEEFRQAINPAKKVADDRVEMALYQRALGVTLEQTKIIQNGGEVIAVEYLEQYPPDTAAAFIWLKNRKGWRDRQDIVVDPLSEKKDVHELGDGEILERLEQIRKRRVELEGATSAPKGKRSRKP